MENQGNLQSIQQEETRAQSPGAAEKLRTIGELAQEFGITLRALRFYQSKGLLIRRFRASLEVTIHMTLSGSA